MGLQRFKKLNFAVKIQKPHLIKKNKNWRKCQTKKQKKRTKTQIKKETSKAERRARYGGLDMID